MFSLYKIFKCVILSICDIRYRYFSFSFFTYKRKNDTNQKNETETNRRCHRMYSLSIFDKMEQPLYGPEISSYWRVSSPCAPVSGWLFDVAEIGKHWLSSESLDDFTTSHHRPSCRISCTFHGIIQYWFARSVRPPLSRMSHKDKRLSNFITIQKLHTT